MIEPKLLSGDELNEIRGNTRVYDNRVAERDVMKLLLHIAAQAEEIARLRTLVVAIEQQAFEGPIANDVDGVDWFAARTAALKGVATNV